MVTVQITVTGTDMVLVTVSVTAMDTVPVTETEKGVEMKNGFNIIIDKQIKHHSSCNGYSDGFGYGNGFCSDDVYGNGYGIKRS